MAMNDKITGPKSDERKSQPGIKREEKKNKKNQMKQKSSCKEKNDYGRPFLLYRASLLPFLGKCRKERKK